MASRSPRVAVDVNEAGWPSYIGGPPNICMTVLERLQAGRPPCDQLAIWKVTTRQRGYSLNAFYCSEDLPAEAHTVLDAEAEGTA